MHPRGNKKYRDIKKLLKLDVTKLVAKYLTCQQVKVEYKLPSRLLQPIKILQWMWECITMDIVSGLPLTLIKKDSIWVIVNRLTKSAHFLPIRTDYSLQKLAKLYISNIVRLHGILVSLFDFEKLYMRHWVLVWILVLPSTHNLTDNPNELFKYLKIF
ncbi:integrase [Gossypium australe]|uniref:Integrase n=1 Tax=Gossypium australe TaxID=47621 RepID=A0A5B6WSL9_9ROSI|nr:integrase [Gossypium australe]